MATVYVSVAANVEDLRHGRIVGYGVVAGEAQLLLDTPDGPVSLWLRREDVSRVLPPAAARSAATAIYVAQSCYEAAWAERRAGLA